jgi:hypothetical protein
MVTTNHHFLDLWYTFRRYYADLITLAAAVCGYWIAAALLDSPRVLFGVSVGITLVATIIIVAMKARGRDFIWFSMRRRQHGEAWIGQGGFTFARTENAYRITGTHDGVILADMLAWSDYRATFLFRLDCSSLGVILRAANLGNLVMLQIYPDRIKAHIRINGSWIVWDHLPELTYKQRLNLVTWYHCEMSCDKRNITITFRGNDQPATMLSWAIPSGTVLFSAGSPQTTGMLPMPFAVNFDYGAFGFRNDGQEAALVRHVLVERL